MGRITQEMLVDGLDAFTAVDSDKAWAVIKRDDEVDALYRKIFAELQQRMMDDPVTVPRAIQIIFVAKHLERIADYVTNICELVVYMKRGAVIKHVYEE
jgi:phosphate transport system protein